MSKPAFTPGPYEAVLGHNGPYRRIPILTRTPQFDEDDRPYHSFTATVWAELGHTPREIAEATAYLMAAAPDLYEALILLLEVHVTEEQRVNAYDKATAALKKAKGES